MGVKGLNKFFKWKVEKTMDNLEGKGYPCYSGKILMSEYVRHHLKWGTKHKWVPQRQQICRNVQNLSRFMSETKANTSKIKMTKFLKN